MNKMSQDSRHDDHPQASTNRRGTAQDHQPSQRERHEGQDHEAMVADFRRRFWVSLALTLPILLLSPLIQFFLGIEGALAFPGDRYLLLALATVVYFYGGWPFLSGLAAELRAGAPGMMTLIALAITVAFAYSAAVVLGLEGKVFFWEFATLIDVMLLGHWVEMKSVMGASGALESLAKLMPGKAQRIKDDGSTGEVPVRELAQGRPVTTPRPSPSLAKASMGCDGYHADAGEIRLGGERIDELPLDERARCGIITAWQEPARFEGIARRFLTLKQRDLDSAALLRKVGLAPARYLDRILAKTLSGGERKRIELAALVGLRPRLALLDESAAGIDLRSVDKIVAIVYELKKAGSAVLLISHREEMARVADRASQL
jgi:ABC-type uncharacterized transport system YnjBCD ATPase subunit